MRAQRLSRAGEIRAARRGPHRSRDALFVVSAVSHEGSARLGVAVSRRVSTRAVTRNRIKRQARESFRLHQAMLQGFDIFVVAQPAAAGCDNAALARSLRAHWTRLVRR